MEYYQRNLQSAAATISTLKKQINTLALSRLGVILGGGAAIFLLVQTESVMGVVLAFLAVLLLFFWLVFRQSRTEKNKRRWEAFELVNQHELGTKSVYDTGSGYADGAHPYTADLDVYGTGSLYAMVNRCATGQGKDLLASWLAQPADKLAVEARQQAVRELAEDPDWCQQLQVDLLDNREAGLDLKQILEVYVSAEATAFGNSVGRKYVQIVPFLLVACFLGSIWLPLLASLGVWLMIMHLLVTLRYAGVVSKIGGRMERTGKLLHTLSSAVERIEKRNWKTPVARELADQFIGSGPSGSGSVSYVFKRLATLLDRLDVRLNMLLGALLNMLFLWDFRQVFALQDWRQQHSRSVLGAIDVVAGFEALLSLAVLSINNPGWTFPRIHDLQARKLVLKQASHPLLDPKKAVPNDYDNGDHGVALITGSNMAGKSTFLRTVGTNVVLALCGAPVCAASMDVSVMYLISYMRIKDSLQESTSTFKAELDRMKLILDTVRKEPHSFFLIDEMLRGTNSVDKYRGSKAIIERLIQDQTVGMVATHDLQLALLEDQYPEVIRNFHFDIQVQEGEMLFDYKLKAGACKIFNASMLLKGIGIDVDPSSNGR